MNISPEEKEFYDAKYPEYGPKRFVKEYEKVFGVPITLDAAKQRACKLGVTVYAPPGYYTVTEAAYIFDVTREAILNRIRNKTIAATKTGRRWLIKDDEFDRIAPFYLDKKTPWPAVTVSCAAKMLGFSSAHGINAAIGRGSIEAVKIGRLNFVRKSDIEWGIKQMKENGFTKIPWYKLQEQKKAA